MLIKADVERHNHLITDSDSEKTLFIPTEQLREQRAAHTGNRNELQKIEETQNKEKHRIRRDVTDGMW